MDQSPDETPFQFRASRPHHTLLGPCRMEFPKSQKALRIAYGGLRFRTWTSSKAPCAKALVPRKVLLGPNGKALGHWESACEGDCGTLSLNPSPPLFLCSHEVSSSAPWVLPTWSVAFPQARVPGHSSNFKSTSQVNLTRSCSQVLRISREAY